MWHKVLPVSPRTQGRATWELRLAAAARYRIGEPRTHDSAVTTSTLTRWTLKSMAYEETSRLILELELPPGEHVTEADLAARFKISKTPIREAFLLLQADGLVSLSPHVGATVTWMSVDEFEELMFIQDALEQPLLPKIASRRPELDWRRIDTLVKRLRQAESRRDGDRYSEVLGLLHEQLVLPSSSDRVWQIVRRVLRLQRRYEKVLVLQFPDAWSLSLASMMGRLTHLRNGDPVGAARVVAEVHEQQLRLARERATLPEVMPYMKHV